MANVIIGSARSDERGRITGGKAGDQKNGKEVSTQSWYKHSKGWRVFRCKIPEMRPLMVEGMKAACANNNIGYDQHQRTTLTELLEVAKWLFNKVTKKCETDCSRLVIDIINCALERLGRKERIPNGNTSSLPRLLLNSGLFEELKGSKYTGNDDYLMASDILNTPTKGHVVMCITDGSKAGSEPEPDKVHGLGDRILKNGMEGGDVKELQGMLIQLGYDLGKWGADGDFGDATELAVEKFQKNAGIGVDGEVGPQTVEALEKALGSEDGDGIPAGANKVRIVGGNCYIRTAPNTGGKKLGVAHENDLLPWQGQQSENGWYLIEYEKQNAWVSGKYAELVKG